MKFILSTIALVLLTTNATITDKAKVIKTPHSKVFFAAGLDEDEIDADESSYEVQKSAGEPSNTKF